MGNSVSYTRSGYDSISESNECKLQNVNKSSPSTLKQSNGRTHSSHTDVPDTTEFHCHQPKPKKDNVSRNLLITVSILCTLLMFAEIVGMIKVYVMQILEYHHDHCPHSFNS